MQTYWITLTYFISYENRNQIHDQDSLFNKIQWLIESLYTSGQVKFYESCTLQSIKNAVSKFAEMNILKKQITAQKRATKTYYLLNEDYRKDNDKINELYE